MTPQTITIPDYVTPDRLDRVLASILELSRTKLQKMIKEGGVTLNGKVETSPDQVARPGMIVTIDESVAVRPYTEIPDTPDPTIIFEDDTYLVVNKPSGLIVHGGPGIYEPTLAEWAVEHDEKIGMVGDRPEIRPGIVHRLDKDVSGVMVIAKTQQAFKSLKNQFQDHSITKEYLALAHGMITSQSGRIAFAIARKPDHSGLMVARPGSTEGKAAETQFTVERFVKGFSLVKVKTLTGRTHQIRVHFKAIGHPLVGDPLYRFRKLHVSKIVAPRLFLHAKLLAFDDLKGERQRFEADLPPDLKQFLDRIG
jgi:23S rRNA pseudouridine1911/1915/1917 synthase